MYVLHSVHDDRSPQHVGETEDVRLLQTLAGLLGQLDKLLPGGGPLGIVERVVEVGSVHTLVLLPPRVEPGGMYSVILTPRLHTQYKAKVYKNNTDHYSYSTLFRYSQFNHSIIMSKPQILNFRNMKLSVLMVKYHYVMTFNRMDCNMWDCRVQFARA